MPTWLIAVVVVSWLALMAIFAVGVRRDGVHMMLVTCAIVTMVYALTATLVIAVVFEEKSAKSKRNSMSDELVTIARLAEQAQLRFARDHEGQFTASLLDLQRYDGRLRELLSPVGDDQQLKIDLTADRREVSVTAMTTLREGPDNDESPDKVHELGYSSHLRIGRLPVRMCSTPMDDDACVDGRWR